MGSNSIQARWSGFGYLVCLGTSFFHLWYGEGSFALEIQCIIWGSLGLGFEEQVAAMSRRAFAYLRDVHQLRPFLYGDLLIVTHVRFTSFGYCNALYRTTHEEHPEVSLKSPVHHALILLSPSL